MDEGNQVARLIRHGFTPEQAVEAVMAFRLHGATRAAEDAIASVFGEAYVPAVSILMRGSD